MPLIVTAAAVRVKGLNARWNGYSIEMKQQFAEEKHYAAAPFVLHGRETDRVATGTARFGDIATTKAVPLVTGGYRVAEAACVTAACVTAAVLLLSFAARLVHGLLSSGILTNAVPINAGLPVWYQAGSFLLTVVVCVGVGMWAKRTTRVGSLVAANIANFVVWQCITLFTLARHFPITGGTEATVQNVAMLSFFAMSFISGLVWAATILFAEIGVALWVAKRFGREVPETYAGEMIINRSGSSPSE